MSNLKVYAHKAKSLNSIWISKDKEIKLYLSKIYIIRTIIGFDRYGSFFYKVKNKKINGFYKIKNGIITLFYNRDVYKICFRLKRNKLIFTLFGKVITLYKFRYILNKTFKKLERKWFKLQNNINFLLNRIQFKRGKVFK